MSESVGRATLRIVSGNPTAEEIAAVTVVLAAASRSESSDHDAHELHGWSDPSRRLRQPITVGPGSWRSSAWQ